VVEQTTRAGVELLELGAGDPYRRPGGDHAPPARAGGGPPKRSRARPAACLRTIGAAFREPRAANQIQTKSGEGGGRGRLRGSKKARRMTGFDFGSLNQQLERSVHAENLDRSADESFREFVAATPDGGNPLTFAASDGTARNLLRSAGPISDAYILAWDPCMLITGPGGSGKTTASVKKSLVEAQRIRPGADGTRRYVLGVWRQKYVNLWKATIPSWWSILPKDISGSSWVGAPPRDATHVVRFEDQHGRIELTAHFRAFGETMDPEDLLGNQYTDCYLNEWSTLPEELFTALVDRVGRDPPQEVIRRPGRFFGDSNAPDVLNYTYRDFYETPPEGYRLFRQPGGLDEGAENLQAMTRGYYENSARLNAHRTWWVKRMVHAKPGFTRANDPVWSEWDDDRNVSKVTLEPVRGLPILTGTDGGLTPATVYMQELSNGQLRILAEVALARGGMRELATAMLQIEEARFAGFQFSSVCDPAMCTGEELEDKSDRQKLSDYIKRKVTAAPTQNPDIRHEAIKGKLRHTIEGGAPGLILDPSCKGLRRGANQTFHFAKTQGTDDLSRVQKTFDSHVCEAAEYGALQCGSAAARLRGDDLERKRRERQEANAGAGRYKPLGRWKRAR